MLEQVGIDDYTLIEHNLTNTEHKFECVLIVSPCLPYQRKTLIYHDFLSLCWTFAIIELTSTAEYIELRFPNVIQMSITCGAPKVMG